MASIFDLPVASEGVLTYTAPDQGDDEVTTLLKGRKKLADPPKYDRELVEAVWEKDTHPRWPAGTVGSDGKDIGGEFMRVGQRFQADGHEWEIAHVAGGQVIANEASGDISKVETRIFPSVINGDQHEIPGATIVPIPKLKQGEGASYTKSNVPIVDAEARADHDPKLKLPAGSSLTGLQWERFGKVDQLLYIALEKRFGKWHKGFAAETVSKVTKDYSSAARAAVQKAFANQYGPGYGKEAGDFLSLQQVFDDNPNLEDARKIYREARELEGDVREVNAWELYNRLKAPDVSLIHLGNRTLVDNEPLINGTKAIKAGYSASWMAGAWSEPTATTYSLGARHVLLATDVGGLHKSHAHEHEITTGDRLKLNSDIAHVWLPAKQSGSVMYWFNKTFATMHDGTTIRSLHAYLKGHGELPLPPEPSNLTYDHQVALGKDWTDPSPEIIAQAKKLAKTAGYANGEDADTALKPVSTLGLKPGDLIEGNNVGKRYLVIASPSGSLGLRYMKLDGSMQTFAWSSGDSTRRKLDAHVDLPTPKLVQPPDVPLFEPEGWTPVGESTTLAKIPVGAKVQVDGDYFTITGHKLGVTQLESLISQKSAQASSAFKTAELGPKPGYVPSGEFVPAEGGKALFDGKIITLAHVGETQFDGDDPDGEKVAGDVADLTAPPQIGVFAAQKGDTFVSDGTKFTVTTVLKNGTVKAKPPTGKVWSFTPAQMKDMTVFRPSDWLIGDQQKIGDLPAGSLVSGSPVKHKPYQVLGTTGPDTFLLNLDTGSQLTVPKNTKYPTLAKPLPPAPVENGTGLDPVEVQPGQSITAAQFTVGDTVKVGDVTYTVGDYDPHGNLWTLKTGNYSYTVADEWDPGTMVLVSHATPGIQFTPMTTTQFVGSDVADSSGMQDATVSGQFMPYKWHKGGSGQVYHKIATMTVGQTFRDKNSKPWVVKQAGVNAVISDGHTNYKVDGHLRGHLTEMPAWIDQAPPVSGDAKAAYDSLDPNTTSKKIMDLHNGDKAWASGAVWTIKQPAGAYMNVTNDATGAGGTLSMSLVPAKVKIINQLPEGFQEADEGWIIGSLKNGEQYITTQGDQGTIIGDHANGNLAVLQADGMTSSVFPWMSIKGYKPYAGNTPKLVSATSLVKGDFFTMPTSAEIPYPIYKVLDPGSVSPQKPGKIMVVKAGAVFPSKKVGQEAKWGQMGLPNSQVVKTYFDEPGTVGALSAGDKFADPATGHEYTVVDGIKHDTPSGTSVAVIRNGIVSLYGAATPVAASTAGGPPIDLVPYKWHKSGASPNQKVHDLQPGDKFTDAKHNPFVVAASPSDSEAVVVDANGNMHTLPKKTGDGKFWWVHKTEAAPEPPADSEGWVDTSGSLNDQDLKPGDMFLSHNNNTYTVLFGQSGSWEAEDDAGGTHWFDGFLHVVKVKKSANSPSEPDGDGWESWDKTLNDAGLKPGDQYKALGGGIGTIVSGSPGSWKAVEDDGVKPYAGTLAIEAVKHATPAEHAGWQWMADQQYDPHTIKMIADKAVEYHDHGKAWSSAFGWAHADLQGDGKQNQLANAVAAVPGVPKPELPPEPSPGPQVGDEIPIGDMPDGTVYKYPASQYEIQKVGPGDLPGKTKLKILKNGPHSGLPAGHTWDATLTGDEPATIVSLPDTTPKPVGVQLGDMNPKPDDTFRFTHSNGETKTWIVTHVDPNGVVTADDGSDDADQVFSPANLVHEFVKADSGPEIALGGRAKLPSKMVKNVQKVPLKDLPVGTFFGSGAGTHFNVGKIVGKTDGVPMVQMDSANPPTNGSSAHVPAFVYPNPPSSVAAKKLGNFKAGEKIGQITAPVAGAWTEPFTSLKPPITVTKHSAVDGMSFTVFTDADGTTKTTGSQSIAMDLLKAEPWSDAGKLSKAEWQTVAVKDPVPKDVDQQIMPYTTDPVKVLASSLPNQTTALWHGQVIRKDTGGWYPIGSAGLVDGKVVKVQKVTFDHPGSDQVDPSGDQKPLKDLKPGDMFKYESAKGTQTGSYIVIGTGPDGLHAKNLDGPNTPFANVQSSPDLMLTMLALKGDGKNDIHKTAFDAAEKWMVEHDVPVDAALNVHHAAEQFHAAGKTWPQAYKHAHMATFPGGAGYALQVGGTVQKALENTEQPEKKLSADVSGIPDYPHVVLKDPKAAGGSTGAKIMTAPDGDKWLKKTYDGDQDRVATELLANSVYRALGIKVPNAGTQYHDGNVSLVYPLEPGEFQAFSGDKTTGQGGDQAKRKALGEGLAADALLGSYDVVGLADDNVLWNGDTPTRIDQGGTFFYRAQGGHKDFGPTPDLWTALVKGQPKRGMLVNEQSLKHQAAHIADTLTDAKIEQLVAQAPFADKNMKQQIKQNLKARRDWMEQFAAGDIDVPENVKLSPAWQHITPVVEGSTATGLKSLDDLLHTKIKDKTKTLEKSWSEIVDGYLKEGQK